MKKLLKKIPTKIPTNILIIFLAILLLFAGYLYKVYLDLNVDYLAYAGAIVGGLFTVVGVTMTINYENDIRKEDQLRHDQEKQKEYEERNKEVKQNLSAQYKPILTTVFTPETFPKEEHFFVPHKYFDFKSQNFYKITRNFNIEEKRYIVFIISVLNIGRGEANDIKIHPFSIILDNEIKDKTIERNTSALYVSNRIDLTLTIEISDKEWDMYANKKMDNVLQFIMKISYKDLVGCEYVLTTVLSSNGLIEYNNEETDKSKRLTINILDTIITNDIQKIKTNGDN